MLLKVLQNSQEHTCARASFLTMLQASILQLIKKETLAQLFLYEFFEIFKSAFFIEHLRWLLLDGQVYIFIKLF